MSEQIVLAEYSGDVVLVNGLCYELAGRTTQPTEDLDVTELFNTCEECTFVTPCNDCALSLRQTYTITLSGLDNPWGGLLAPGDWNGSHTAHNNEPHPYGPGSASECLWQVTEFPAEIATANLSVSWYDADNQWKVRCQAHTAAYLLWEGPTDPCDPRGSYGSHVGCFYNHVEDAPPCDTQGATTCTVS